MRFPLASFSGSLSETEAALLTVEELTAEESKAVETALSPYRALVRRFGEDRERQRDFESFLLGYRGFAERLAGDAVRRIDYVLSPKLADIREGDELRLPGVTFSHVRRDPDTSLSVTAVDDEGVQRFRLNWEADGDDRTQVTIQQCPAHDPQYPYADGLAYGTLLRENDPVENRCHGTVWSHHYFEFIDAVDLMRPALGAEILAMPRQKPLRDGFPWSSEELDKLSASEISRLDGGLPGPLARHVVETMLRERGSLMLRSIADRADAIASWLEGEGCVWGGAAMAMHDRDNLMYAVRAGDGNLALLFQARNTAGPYTTFLVWKDDASGTATVAAAMAGQHVWRVVEAFLRGEAPDAPMATVNLATGEHDMGGEIVQTAVLDLALCHIRYVEGDLNATEDEDDRFERVDDFEFFVDANSFDDEDERAPEEIVPTI